MQYVEYDLAMKLTKDALQEKLKKFGRLRNVETNELESLASFSGRTKHDALEIVLTVLNALTNKAPRFMVPQEKMLYLYLGYSPSLYRYKIGVTENCVGRQKSMNASLLHVGLVQDFEIIDNVFGFEQTIRNLEGRSKKILQKMRLTGEWYDISRMVPDAFDLLASQGLSEYKFLLKFYDVTAKIDSFKFRVNDKFVHAEFYKLIDYLQEWISYYEIFLENGVINLEEE